ncbi:hypothetical protein [Natroniella sp. ANB-PHB2]|uniref:hypothetical protein n=1 Tax=Natroniella sp. ANB-PHB2 TaxID=3384444 RepID=UPI0038D45A9F
MKKKINLLLKILKFKKFMKPFLFMFGFGILLVGFTSLSSIRTFSEFLEFVWGYFLMIIGALIGLKFFELIAILAGANKIYNSIFEEKNEKSSND